MPPNAPGWIHSIGLCCIVRVYKFHGEDNPCPLGKFKPDIHEGKLPPCVNVLMALNAICGIIDGGYHAPCVQVERRNAAN